MGNLILNKPKCSDRKGETGVPPCWFNMKNIIGAILVDADQGYTASDITDFQTTLQTAVIAADSTKVYPIGRFVEMTDDSEDEQINTFGYGDKEVTREGDYDHVYRFVKGGMCLLKQLRKFNESYSAYKFLLIDSDNKVIGTKASDDKLYGLSMGLFYGKKVGFNDGSNPAMYAFRVVLNKPEELNDNFGYVACSFDVLGTVKGNLMLDVVESQVAFGTATVTVQTACDQVDMYTNYDDEFADTTAFVVTDEDGDTVSITSVVKNTSVQGWDISFTGTGTHYIKTAGASVLSGLGIGGAPENGYESNTLEVTMPTS